MYFPLESQQGPRNLMHDYWCLTRYSFWFTLSSHSLQVKFSPLIIVDNLTAITFCITYMNQSLDLRILLFGIFLKHLYFLIDGPFRMHKSKNDIRMKMWEEGTAYMAYIVLDDLFLLAASQYILTSQCTWLMLCQCYVSFQLKSQKVIIQGL